MTLSDVCNIPDVIWISNWKFFCVPGQKPFRTSKANKPTERPFWAGWRFATIWDRTVVVVITEKRRENFWKSEKFLKNSKILLRLTLIAWIKFEFWSSLYKLWSMYNFAAHPIRHFDTFTSGGPKFQLKSQTQNEEWTLGIFVDENLMVTWCSIIGESSYVLELSYG